MFTDDQTQPKQLRVEVEVALGISRHRYRALRSFLKSILRSSGCAAVSNCWFWQRLPKVYDPYGDAPERAHVQQPLRALPLSSDLVGQRPYNFIRFQKPLRLNTEQPFWLHRTRNLQRISRRAALYMVPSLATAYGKSVLRSSSSGVLKAGHS